ncbi:MAG: EAL domain-containing protein [Olsenella sp.]|nr:EAL domain-containing protein [Olsenella sp.]
MVWVFEYAYSALLLQCLLLFFYLLGKQLPTYQNICFRRILETGCVTTTLDIVTCIMLEHVDSTPPWLLHGGLISFYIFFLLRMYLLFEFTLCLTGVKYRLGKAAERLFEIPLLLFCALTVTAPWTHFIYRIAPDGVFWHSRSYFSLYVTFAIYLALCLYLVIRYRKRLRKLQFFGYIGFCGLLTLGSISRMYNDDNLSMNLFYAIAIMVIYLTIQDPSRYLRGNNTFFNQEGLYDLAFDHIERNQKMALMCLRVNNYEEVKSSVGKRGGVGMQENVVESFFQSMPRPMIVFYLGNGCFVLVDQGETEEEAFREAVDKYFNDPVDPSDELLTMKAATAYIPASMPKASVGELLAAVNYLFSELRARGRESRLMGDAHTLRKMERDFEVDEALERTIRDASILLYYQPIYSCSEHRFTSAEVLSRIEDEKLGFLMPVDFIENAERSGSIMRLDQLVYEKACSFIQRNDLGKIGLDYLEVNLSPVCGSHEGLEDDLRRLAGKYGISLHSLNLEITESAASDMMQMSRYMEALGSEGMKFSLDDYGTGFSNVIKIMSLPFEIIKIDKSIVWSYFRGENNYLKSIIGNFREQGFKVLAEGVETEEMASELERLGCDYEQGFYYSKPICETEFLRFLQEQ